MSAPRADHGQDESASVSLDISDELYSLFTSVISREAGIRLGPRKKALLSARLSKRMKAIGCTRFYDYYRLIKKSPEERIEMLNAIAINTTKFFREPYHFEFLREKILPEIFLRKSAEKFLRIWSAGCSTGEEPYSIALTVLESMKKEGVNPLTWDARVLASDISTRVLKTADKGVYERDQLPEMFSQGLVDHYFDELQPRREGRVAVKPFVKELIRFRRLNLKESSYPFSRRFDIIFCRNVMIYFDETMQRHVIDGFRTHLLPGGHLFLGHSESMLQRQGFAPAHITVYRRTD